MIDQVYDTSNIDDMLLGNESLTIKDEQGSIYSPDGKKLYKGVLVNKLIVRNGVEIICDEALYSIDPNSVIKEIVLPDTVKAIGNLAFFNNVELHTINIPSSVKAIYDNPFAGCLSLKEIDSQSSIFATFDGILFGNRRENVLISALSKENDKVTINLYPWDYIGAYAFWNLRNNAKFENWYHIKKIGKYAFYGITSEIININSDYIDKIPESCFENSNIKEIVFNSNCKKVDANAFRKSSVENVTLDYILEIGANAFEDCYNITEIKLSSYNTVVIAKEAFCQSGIEKINLDNVANIGDRAFADCHNLTNIYLQKIKEIGNYAFYNCAIRRLVLPDSIQSIGDYAFMGCPLSYVSIGSTSCYIGVNSFRSDELGIIRCHKNLIDNPNIQQYNQKWSDTILLSLDDPCLYYEQKMFLWSESIESPISERNEQIEKLLGISYKRGYCLIQRMPHSDKFLWGVKVDFDIVIPPMFDKVHALFSLDDLYALTTTITPISTLYQLFYNRESVYTEFSNQELHISKNVANFKSIYYTSGMNLYDERHLRKEFLDYRNKSNSFEYALSTKIVSIQKNGKYALIANGNKVSDFIFDGVYAIDNVCLSKKRTVIPLLSLEYVIVSKIINGNKYQGIVDSHGTEVVPIKHSQICACHNYVLADNQLFYVDRNGMKLVSDNIDTSISVYIYEGTIAFYSCMKQFYVFRNSESSLIEGSKYTILKRPKYEVYFDVENRQFKAIDNRDNDFYVDDGYSRSELNDMYRDAFDGNSEYESNID